MDTSVNAANQVVSVGADIAFDADPKFFACLVRFESSSVPTTLPTAYDVYPLDGRHDGGYYTVKDCVTIDVLTRTPLFFFQAEDGIRDVAVTGVQTCALPISHRTRSGEADDRHGFVSRERRTGIGPVTAHQVHDASRHTRFGQYLYEVIRGKRRI